MILSFKSTLGEIPRRMKPPLTAAIATAQKQRLPSRGRS